VGVVDNGRDPAYGVAVAKGEEVADFRVVVERMMPKVEQLLLDDANRRNPVRIVAIELPRQIEELLPLSS
jgi:hypothetical protein